MIPGLPIPQFDNSPNGAYFRVKMAKTLVDALQDLDDPRLAVWANKVEIPLVLDAGAPDGTDEIIDGERHISQDIVDAYVDIVGEPVDYDKEYIGLPTAMVLAGAYNLKTVGSLQGSGNPHASQLNDIYKAASGPIIEGPINFCGRSTFYYGRSSTQRMGERWSTGPL